MSFPVVFRAENCAVHSRESHSFLNLPADTTMASSQGTSASSNSFSRCALHDIFLYKYHFSLHILRFLFFFSDNIMADVASKQQTTSLFLSTNIHTHKKTHRTDKPDGKRVLCQRTFSSVFRAVLLHSRNTNKMQLCNRICYSKGYWRLNMFRGAHRSSSGDLNCICSLWFIYACGDRPLPTCFERHNARHQEL